MDRIKARIANFLSQRKGQFGAMDTVIGLALGLAVASLVLSQTAKVNSDVSSSLTGSPKDAVDNGTQGIVNLSKGLPTVGTLGVAIVLIALILRGLVGAVRS
ncbi:MAG: hypothetical protein A2W22_05520 [Candidatus Levybacteria bacterium RBG_16_35_11]|nr:MAG: hypothetical protein A2W22_05520 [Candidatus Levybacteria bacterium RBG_16_35_11]